MVDRQTAEGLAIAALELMMGAPWGPIRETDAIVADVEQQTVFVFLEPLRGLRIFESFDDLVDFTNEYNADEAPHLVFDCKREKQTVQEAIRVDGDNIVVQLPRFHPHVRFEDRDIPHIAIHKDDLRLVELIARGLGKLGRDMRHADENASATFDRQVDVAGTPIRFRVRDIVEPLVSRIGRSNLDELWSDLGVRDHSVRTAFLVARGRALTPEARLSLLERTLRAWDAKEDEHAFQGVLLLVALGDPAVVNPLLDVLIQDESATDLMFQWMPDLGPLLLEPALERCNALTFDELFRVVFVLVWAGLRDERMYPYLVRCFEAEPDYHTAVLLADFKDPRGAEVLARFLESYNPETQAAELEDMWQLADRLGAVLSPEATKRLTEWMAAQNESQPTVELRGSASIETERRR